MLQFQLEHTRAFAIVQCVASIEIACKELWVSSLVGLSVEVSVSDSINRTRNTNYKFAIFCVT